MTVVTILTVVNIVTVVTIVISDSRTVLIVLTIVKAKTEDRRKLTLES